jgi:hypothetical protein
VVASHECGLIAVEKPDGILSHPNPGEVAEKGTILITGNYSLDEEAFHVRDGKGGIRRVYLLNRLDSPTSGTLLLSLDEGVADLVRKMFARSQVWKRYVALIRGRGLRTPRGTWQDQMAKTKGPGGGVRSDIPSHPLHFAGDIDQLANIRVVVVELLKIFALRQRVFDGNLGVVRDQFADLDHSIQRQPQGSANILDGTTSFQGTEGSDLSDVRLAVLFFDVANDFAASFLAKVDIDIGCFESAFVEESFEQ